MTGPRGWQATAAGVALSALFLWLALREVDAAALAASLASARWWVVAPFLLCLFAYYWVKTLRWVALLRPIVHTSPRTMFVPVMIGYAAGAVMPMQLGELVRGWLGARRLGIRLAAAFMSIALERVLDLVSILLLVAVTMAFLAEVSPVVSTAARLLAAVALGALGVLLLLVFRTQACIRFATRACALLPEPVARRVLEQLDAGVGGLAALRDPRLLAVAAMTSLLQWTFMFACVWLSLFALDVSVGPAAAMLALVFMVIGTSLPNSPGYVGSIQLAFTLALAPFGVEASTAVAASLFFHLLAYLSVVLTGLALLPVMGVHISDLRAAAGASVAREAPP